MHNPEQRQAFFDALFARCTAYQDACLTLTAIHPDGKHNTPSRHIPLHDTDALRNATAQLDRANAQGWGAYFAVGLRRSGLTRWQRGGAADVIALPALFVDADDPSPESLRRLQCADPTPSCIVASGGGYHAYWWLDEPITDLQTARHLLRGLATALHGDRLSVAQSLRLPQTANTKSDRGGLCHVIQMNDRCYSPGAFDALTPDHARQPQQREKPYTTAQTVYDRRLNPALVQVVTDRLTQMGYSGRGDWLSGPCLYPARHQHGDVRPSFGFNVRSGYGNCYVCGSILLKNICPEIGIHPADYGGLFV